MSREKTENQDPDDPEGWWDDVPEWILEGFRAEQEMWEYAEALEAEILKPRGILGFFGYRMRPACY